MQEVVIVTQNDRGALIMSDKKLPQLVMMLPELSSLPPMQLPEGYSGRSLRVGEESDWEHIVSEAFGRSYQFAETLAKYDLYKPDAVQFICDGGDRPVATATAWHRDKWGDHCGYVHMVGVLAAHGGKGLGAQVSIMALNRMEQEGFSTAVLNTDDFRLPAIRTYLKIGFVPYIDHESHESRWAAIAEQLGDHGLAARLIQG
jgi:mycothiol synthase